MRGGERVGVKMCAFDYRERERERARERKRARIERFTGRKRGSLHVLDRRAGQASVCSDPLATLVPG